MHYMFSAFEYEQKRWSANPKYISAGDTIDFKSCAPTRLILKATRVSPHIWELVILAPIGVVGITEDIRDLWVV
jgi:hypothetical protein